MTSIQHRLFGTLVMTHTIPAIDMFWWRGEVEFEPAHQSVVLDLHASPTGPNEIQAAAYTKLLQTYSTLHRLGMDRGDIPTGNGECRLVKITFFRNGQIDLHFSDGTNQYRIYANANGEYLTPASAIES